MAKFREIVIRPPVKLPALTTEIPERDYSFLTFLGEWVLGARGLRKDENLVHLFELEEKVEAFGKKLEEKTGVKPPEPPKKPSEDEASAYQDKAAEYRKAVEDASVGEHLYCTDECFTAAKQAAKDALDKAATERQLPPAYEAKVLRHYHAFTQSKAVNEADIPKQ